jgi:hypothetical protein
MASNDGRAVSGSPPAPSPEPDGPALTAPSAPATPPQGDLAKRVSDLESQVKQQLGRAKSAQSQSERDKTRADGLQAQLATRAQQDQERTRQWVLDSDPEMVGKWLQGEYAKPQTNGLDREQILGEGRQTERSEVAVELLAYAREAGYFADDQEYDEFVQRAGSGERNVQDLINLGARNRSPEHREIAATVAAANQNEPPVAPEADLQPTSGPITVDSLRALKGGGQASVEAFQAILRDPDKHAELDRALSTAP